MTMPPPPGAPFPAIGGHPVDPSRDQTDLWGESLRDRLFVERVVFVADFLDDDVANRAAMELMTLDANGDAPVQLHLDCRGGTLGAAFVLMDVIDTMGVEVRALCAGQIVGTTVGIVAVADQRVALRHSRFRLCEPKLELGGRPRDIVAASEHHTAQLGHFYERVSEATGQPVSRIADDMRRGRFLGAEEAREYGLVDEVARPEAKVLEFPRTFGFRRT